MKFQTNDTVLWKSRLHGERVTTVAVCLGGNYAQYQVRVDDGKLAIVGEEELTLVKNAPQVDLEFEMCPECKRRYEEIQNAKNHKRS